LWSGVLRSRSRRPLLGSSYLTPPKKSPRWVAVGEGKLLNNGELKPLKVKEGDVVLFNKYAGTEVELDGEQYLIMSEDEVLAVVEDAKVPA